eukprot:CAMPEP_0177773990 /NCGR_PEP_ID=MMETSP0491_2-20121128/13223_1 /TAXON_ID=63592 /ORGANISM="Tetraselmis chuii, Strain PLY429" /LENGTH=170 /DNA_ID=CAMNT_0019292249 /DNA_START=71 /DNA_END=583 /DNA_ORIENTATION=-
MAYNATICRAPVAFVASGAPQGRQQRRQQNTRAPTILASLAPKPADLLAGALFLGATFGATSPVDAKLPAGMSKSSENPYADVMKSRMSAPSAEDLYKKGGGACGPGFELQRTLSVGANCVCVDQTVCDLSRAEMSIEERSFGKKKDEPAPENSIVGNDGMVFTFDFEQQ